MESLVKSTSKTKITDLNYYCLETVFLLLSLGDLLNVADSNSHLRIAAASTYSYKYGKRKVRIIHPCLSMKEDVIRKSSCMEPDSVTLGSWKNCYQILRCFGHLMEKVELNIRLNGRFKECKLYSNNELFGTLCKHFFTYLNEYCVDSLNEINIIGQLVHGTLNHVKPFPLVETVIMDGNFEKNILTNLFPKLRNLILDYAYSSDFLAIDSHFSHLENMTLTYLYVEPSQDLVSKHYAQIYSFLNLNPKLKSLTSPTIANKDFLQTIAKCVPNLQSLSLYDHFLYFKNYSLTHFEHLKCFGYPISSFPKILHTFGHLEELRSGSRNDKYYAFIAKNLSIRKITAICGSNLQYVDPVLAQLLPNLEEYEYQSIWPFHLDMEDIYDFVGYQRYLTKLQKVTFRAIHGKPDEIESFLNGGWKCSKLTKVCGFSTEPHFDVELRKI